MDQPYQPPAAEPLDPPGRLSRKPDAGGKSRLAAGTALFISIWVMGFLFKYGSFLDASSGAPSFLRSAFSGMHEDRAVLATMVLALVTILLSFSPRLSSAARALAFASLTFALTMGSIALYLTAKSTL